MSRVAIVCYDLRKVDEDDNYKVKEALLKHTNVFTTLSGFNKLSTVPSWVTLDLPDTTILVSVADNVKAEVIVNEVDAVIRKAGAKTGKIYVAFLSLADDFLYNAVS